MTAAKSNAVSLPHALDAALRAPSGCAQGELSRRFKGRRLAEMRVLVAEWAASGRLIVTPTTPRFGRQGTRYSIAPGVPPLPMPSPRPPKNAVSLEHGAPFGWQVLVAACRKQWLVLPAVRYSSRWNVLRDDDLEAN